MAADNGTFTRGYLDLVPVFEDWPKDLVRANFVFLVRNIKPKELLIHIEGQGLLTETEMQLFSKQLDDSKITTQDINRRLLLDWLPRKSPGSFDGFAFCLYFADEGAQRQILRKIEHFPDGQVRVKFQRLMGKLLAVDKDAVAVQETGAGQQTCESTACTNDPAPGDGVPSFLSSHPSQ